MTVARQWPRRFLAEFKLPLNPAEQVGRVPAPWKMLFRHVQKRRTIEEWMLIEVCRDMSLAKAIMPTDVTPRQYLRCFSDSP